MNVFTDEGNIYYWGDESNEWQNMDYPKPFHPRPRQVVDHDKGPKTRTVFLKISSGAHHSLYLDPKGWLLGAGRNDHGQLGSTFSYNRIGYERFKWTRFKGLVVDIACGGNFSVLLTKAGSVFICGDTAGLIPGMDEASKYRNKPTPYKISLPQSVLFRKIVCRAAHILALSSDGRVYSWASTPMDS